MFYRPALFIILFLGFMCVLFYMMLKSADQRKKELEKSEQESRESEAQTMNEMFEILERMEKRVQDLETLIDSKDKKG